MPTIRIPEEHWGKVWRFLVETGPIGRTSKEPIYHISDRQLQMLRKKSSPLSCFRLRTVRLGERSMIRKARISARDFRRLGSPRFVAKLKTSLLQEFDQLEILITESPLRVH
jgi:hypothetical protein